MTRDEIASLSPKAVLWDGLDEAIIGLAKREDFGPLVIYNADGIVDIKLDPSFYNGFEDDDEFDSIDNWERPSFEGLVAYDVEKAIKILMNDMEVSDDDVEDGMTRDDAAYMMALEYFGYNVSGAFVGDYTPLHLFIEETE
jgi:hypothetical protein